MISINLNAIREWERIRSETEPQTRDVDRNPGTEDADAPGLDNGSHGVRVRPAVRKRDHGENEEPEREENEAYEVEIGDEEPGYGPPPDGSRAPVEPYQGQNVDLEA